MQRRHQDLLFPGMTGRVGMKIPHYGRSLESQPSMYIWQSKCQRCKMLTKASAHAQMLTLPHPSPTSTLSTLLRDTGLK